MRRYYIYIIGIVLLLAGCDMETSDNGDLDGLWVMQSMEYGPAGWARTDLHTSGLTWSFQGHILELRDVNKVHQDIAASFEHEGDNLTVHDFYFVDRDEGDRVVEDDYTYLLPYGVPSNILVTFKIVELTSARMKLESATTRLEFRKY